MSSALSSRLAIFAAAGLFSTGGAVIKACSLSGWQVASFRSAVAAVTVFLVMPEARRRWSRGSMLVGATYAVTMILFVIANKLTTAANAIFLQYTSPLYILLLEPWLLDEPVRRRDLGFLAVLGLGLVLFFVDPGVDSSTAPHPVLGNAVALLSGVSWAGTAIGLRWMARGGGAVALPVSGARPLDWALILYLGVFQISAAYFFLARGLRTVSALEATLLLLLEPVLNPVWAWIVEGEQPGRWSLVGGGIIVVATAAKTWDESRHSRKTP